MASGRDAPFSHFFSDGVLHWGLGFDGGGWELGLRRRVFWGEGLGFASVCGGRGRVSVGGSFYGRTSIWRHFVRISEILEPACLLVSHIAASESSLLFNR